MPLPSPSCPPSAFSAARLIHACMLTLGLCAVVPLTPGGGPLVSAPPGYVQEVSPGLHIQAAVHCRRAKVTLPAAFVVEVWPPLSPLSWLSLSFKGGSWGHCQHRHSLISPFLCCFGRC